MVPMEGTTLAGLINMDLQSKGRLSVLEAEQYDQLPTNGNMTIGLSKAWLQYNNCICNMY